MRTAARNMFPSVVMSSLIVPIWIVTYAASPAPDYLLFAGNSNRLGRSPRLVGGWIPRGVPDRARNRSTHRRRHSGTLKPADRAGAPARRFVLYAFARAAGGGRSLPRGLRCARILAGKSARRRI